MDIQIFVVVYDNGETYEDHSNHNVGVFSDVEQAHAFGQKYVADMYSSIYSRGHYYIEVWNLDGEQGKTIQARKLKAWRRKEGYTWKYCATEQETFENMSAFAKANGWNETEVDFIPHLGVEIYSTPFGTLYLWEKD